jgi:Flp pilus assembly protein TadB
MNKDQLRRRPRVLHISIYIPVIIGLVLLLAGYFVYWPAMLALGIVGVIVILGFGLPRWIGMKEREKRARGANKKKRASGLPRFVCIRLSTRR